MKILFSFTSILISHLSLLFKESSLGTPLLASNFNLNKANKILSIAQKDTEISYMSIDSSNQSRCTVPSMESPSMPRSEMSCMSREPRVSSR